MLNCERKEVGGRIQGLAPDDFLVWRLASGGTVEILDISVTSKWRRTGRGRALIQTLFQFLSENTRVYAITRTSNLIAQTFYERLSFKVVGVLREFYEGNNTVDAIMYGRLSSGPV